MPDNQTPLPELQRTQDRIDLRVWHDDAGFLIHGSFSVTGPQGLVVLLEAMSALRPLLASQEQHHTMEAVNAH